MPRSASAHRLPCRSSSIAAASTAFIMRRKGMRVHLGGIGKGYAVDRGRRHRFGSAGSSDFMVQAGGDLYVAGRRGDRPWRLGIQDPRGPADSVFAVGRAVGRAPSARRATTSASSSRTAVRYHHIIDPDRGEPAARHAAASRSSRDRAVVADASVDGRLRARTRERHGAHRAPAPRGGRHRHGREPGPGVEWPEKSRLRIISAPTDGL